MAKRGRKRKPTGIHLAEGTWRGDRHGDPEEEMQIDGEPLPDNDLPEFGLKLWNQIVPVLVEAGAVTFVDSPLLNKLCRLYARGMMWDKEIFSAKRIDDKLYKKERISSLIWNDFNKVAAKFGMSPSDRTNIRLEKPAEDMIPARNRKA